MKFLNVFLFGVLGLFVVGCGSLVERGGIPLDKGVFYLENRPIYEGEDYVGAKRFLMIFNVIKREASTFSRVPEYSRNFQLAEVFGEERLFVLHIPDKHFAADLGYYILPHMQYVPLVDLPDDLAWNKSGVDDYLVVEEKVYYLLGESGCFLREYDLASGVDREVAVLNDQWGCYLLYLGDKTSNGESITVLFENGHQGGASIGVKEVSIESGEVREVVRVDALRFCAEDWDEEWPDSEPDFNRELNCPPGSVEENERFDEVYEEYVEFDVCPEYELDFVVDLQRYRLTLGEEVVDFEDLHQVISCR